MSKKPLINENYEKIYNPDNNHYFIFWMFSQKKFGV